MSLVDVVEPVRLTDAQWFQLVVVASAVLALAAALWRYVVQPVLVLAGEVRDFLEDWRGAPARPGVRARPGAMARLAQLENNGGTSVKDMVEQTRRLSETTSHQVEALAVDGRRQWTAIQHLARFHEHDPDPPEHPEEQS